MGPSALKYGNGEAGEEEIGERRGFCEAWVASAGLQSVLMPIRDEAAFANMKPDEIFKCFWYMNHLSRCPSSPYDLCNPFEITFQVFARR